MSLCCVDVSSSLRIYFINASYIFCLRLVLELLCISFVFASYLYYFAYLLSSLGFVLLRISFIFPVFILVLLRICFVFASYLYYLLRIYFVFALYFAYILFSPYTSFIFCLHFIPVLLTLHIFSLRLVLRLCFVFTSHLNYFANFEPIFLTILSLYSLTCTCHFIPMTFLTHIKT